MRGRFLFAAAVVLLAMAVPAPGGTSSPPVTRAQVPAVYEIDVLAGAGATGATPGDVRMTSGWHTDTAGTFDGIDIGVSRGTDVHAVFRVVGRRGDTFARVSEIVTEGPTCRKVQVRIYEVIFTPDTVPAEVKPRGDLHYLHTVPSVSVGDSVPLGGLLPPKKIGDVVAWENDGSACPNFADHLHQSAKPPSAGTSLWRNVDRGDRLDDDGLGFDPIDAGYDAPEKTFCSDTWIFKIYPPTPATETDAERAPQATNIASCAAPDVPREALNWPQNTADQAVPGRSVA